VDELGRYVPRRVPRRELPPLPDFHALRHAAAMERTPRRRATCCATGTRTSPAPSTAPTPATAAAKRCALAWKRAWKRQNATVVYIYDHADRAAALEAAGLSE
jgi:hypothetical protein